MYMYLCYVCVYIKVAQTPTMCDLQLRFGGVLKSPLTKNAVPLTETFQRQLPILGNCARATGYVEYYWFAKSMEK